MSGVVLDVSNHDLSTFDAECLRASGVERIIIGCWDYTATATILKRARAAGIIVEDLYCYLYYGKSWERQELHNALAIANAYGGIKRIWADVEADQPNNEEPGTSVAYRHRVTHEVVAAIEANGYQPGIYTYPSYWVNQMGNTTAFRHLPLWLASWGKDGKPTDPIRTVNFGGWTDVAVHQYTSMVERCGRRRDHNYWFLSDEEDDMELRKQLEDLKIALFAGSERREQQMSREEKLRLANWYIEETLAEKRQSMADVAASAIAVVGQLAREVARGGDADIDALEQMAELFERNAAELRALRAEKR